MRWTVDWETWNFDENSKISSITWISIEFQVEADSLEEAERIATSQAPKELHKVRERIPWDFTGVSNSVPKILGLRDENGEYYRLSQPHTVFGGQVTEVPGYGSFE